MTATARPVSGTMEQVATMQQIVQDGYGSTAVMHLREVPKPEIGDDGVLVRVRAASVNALDWHMLRGTPFLVRLSEGWRRPKTAPGVDLAGVVEAVGRDVTELAVGDEVFGGRNGSFAEYSAGRVRNFVRKPANLTFEQAAAIPVAAVTALQAVRDQAHIQAGQRALVMGAGGGVGTFAVQIAKAFGAHVTATANAAVLETLRSAGADEVLDYARTDVATSGGPYDAILDVGGYGRLGDLNRILRPGGVVVSVGAGDSTLRHLVWGIVESKLRSRFRHQDMRHFLAKLNRDDLLVLADLAAAGRIVPVIDRVVPLAEVPAAIAYVEAGKARGKVVVSVG
ncbi:MAG TPA: NAD(P)-dependent alcohol dehydrogenase [Candidatus Limnocylindrales bacterium]|nr:NAD(P)-dependent alcohol dehydrogenase [Candidatus Limnocylindrales bacterium]